MSPFSPFTRFGAGRRRLAVGASTATLALIFLAAVLWLAGPAASLVPEEHESSGYAPAVPDRTAEDRELERQLKEVEARFPLAFRALAFHRDYLSKVCLLDEVCFRQTQDLCLSQGLPPRFCFEDARKKCCKLPQVVFELPPA